MLRTLGFFVIVSAACLAAFTQEPDTAPKRVDLPFSWTDASKPVAVPAPDQKLVLRVVGKTTGRSYPDDELEPDYFIERGGQRLSPSIHTYSSPYAMWSPSSHLLAITSTDGGLVGSWEVFVYGVEQDKVVKHNVMKQVQVDLARR
ncbi:MAG TPA: hypothetical protein VGG15_11380, partial [Terriglobales bacterium]